jgi:hypothetical protein
VFRIAAAGENFSLDVPTNDTYRNRDFERSCNDATQVETTASRSEIAAISRALRYCHRGQLHSSSGQQEKDTMVFASVDEHLTA